MNSAVQSFLHLSQNIPSQSPLVVKMRKPRQSQVQVSQAVPSASPLTWRLEGDPGVNQVGTWGLRPSHCLTVWHYYLRYKWLKTLQTTTVR